MNGVNLKTLGIPKAALDDNNDLTSENGMLKEYKRLLVVLKQLQILKKRTIDQTDNAKKEIIELEQEIEKYSNLHVMKNTLSVYLDNRLLLLHSINFRHYVQRLAKNMNKHRPSWLN